MQEISFTGNDTFLLDGNLLPPGLASDTCVSINFPNPLTESVIGYDGSIGMGLLKNGLKADVTLRIFAGSSLMNLIIGIQRSWINNPSSAHTFSATKITDSAGGTYTIELIGFQIATIMPFQSSNSSVKDAIELEVKFTGTYNPNV